MPAPARSNSLPTTQILVHNSATDFLNATLPILRNRERSANIILAHALKIREEEVSGRGHHGSSTYPIFWITCWSMQPTSATSQISHRRSSVSYAPSLDMVLSCVDWTLGTYPIFLWSGQSPASLSPSWIIPRVSAVASRLRSLVPEQRVFSVFGATCLTKAFVKYWSEITGNKVHPEPFYSASYSFCTKQTLTNERKGPLPAGHRIRRAIPEDLHAVANLCQLFAEESIYFPLTDEGALIEANELIAKRLLWVYEVCSISPDGRTDIAISSICAVTRSSWTVSAITKVYTHPLFRQKGLAERLVRQVTKELLFELGREEVVLYVGHDNPAANVYNRVGFQGLCGKPKIEGVEDWLELGFLETDRGHW